MDPKSERISEIINTVSEAISNKEKDEILMWSAAPRLPIVVGWRLGPRPVGDLQPPKVDDRRDREASLMSVGGKESAGFID